MRSRGLCSMILAVAWVAACSPAADAGPSAPRAKPAGAAANAQAPAAGGSAAPALTPAAAEAKARAFLQRQIDAARGDDKALVASFTADAVILIDGHASDADGVSRWGLGDGGPDGAPTAAASISRLVAGGTADAVWFYADVTTRSAGPGRAVATRVTELVVAAEQWRAVAASFGRGAALQVSDSNLEIANATGRDGALAKLLGSPAALGGALDPAAIVVGPVDTQLAHGGGGPAALAGWKLAPIALYQRAREVHTPAWGFVQAYYDHPTGAPGDIARGIAQAFALPASDGTWRVVLVQYRAR